MINHFDRRCFATLLLSLGLAGCSTGGAPSAVDPVAKGYFLPYFTPTGAFLVDSADFSHVVPIVRANISRALIHRQATFSNRQIAESLPHSFVYFARRHWFKSNLGPGVNSLPVRISAEDSADPCHAEIIDNDYSQPDSAYLAYGLPGPDGECFGVDDTFRRIRLGDSPTTPPEALPNFPITAFYDTEARLTGILTWEGSTLNLYDANFGNPKAVLAGIAATSVMARSGSGAILDVDGSIRLVTPEGVASAPLHSISSDYCRCFATSQDEAYVYFVEGKMPDLTPSVLWRLKLDGSEPAVKMYETTDTPIYTPVTTNAVILYSQAGDGATLRSVPKNATYPAEAITLDTVSAGGISLATSGSSVFYTVQSYDIESAGISARLKRDDGTALLNLPKSQWVGQLDVRGGHPQTGITRNYPLGLLAQGLMEVDGAGGEQGATLKVYDFATDTATDIQVLSDDGFHFLYLEGQADLGSIRASGVGGLQTDILAFDLETKELRRVTSTPSISEVLVGSASIID